MAATCIWPLGAELGEGPVWREAEQAIWFVDIKGQQLHRFDTRTAQTETWACPEPVGFIAPMADRKWIAGLKSGLHIFDPETGSFKLLYEADKGQPGNRLNDGFVDWRGRLWFGSMDDAEIADSGALYRLDREGVAVLDEGYCITNGPATSPDGRIFYHTNTLQRLIYAYDLSEQGVLSGKRVFARIEDGVGYPDGTTVDSRGRVWIALFGGWAVRCYAPDGKLLHVEQFPCANVTKIAFGGPDLTTVYVTTARKGLTPEQLANQPLAGGLFQFRSDVPGLTQYEVAHG